MAATNQAAEPPAPPRRTRGSSPARTRLDLPLPEPPTTRINRPCGPSSVSRARISSTSPSRPKKSSASGSSNARSPLYGLGRSTRGSAGWPDSAPTTSGTSSSSGGGSVPRQSGGQHLGDLRRHAVEHGPGGLPPGERLGHQQRQVPGVLAGHPGATRAQREVRQVGRAGLVEQNALGVRPARGRCRRRPRQRARRRPWPPAPPARRPARALAAGGRATSRLACRRMTT